MTHSKFLSIDVKTPTVLIAKGITVVVNGAFVNNVTMVLN